MNQSTSSRSISYRERNLAIALNYIKSPELQRKAKIQRAIAEYSAPVFLLLLALSFSPTWDMFPGIKGTVVSGFILPVVIVGLIFLWVLVRIWAYRMFTKLESRVDTRYDDSVRYLPLFRGRMP